MTFILLFFDFLLGSQPDTHTLSRQKIILKNHRTFYHPHSFNEKKIIFRDAAQLKCVRVANCVVKNVLDNAFYSMSLITMMREHSVLLRKPKQEILIPNSWKYVEIVFFSLLLSIFKLK